MAIIPSVTEKCTGAMLASAIGDALGWPNELGAKNSIKNTKVNDQFIEWTRRSGGRYWPYYEKILPGEYSDDTQMILAVARSVITGNWESTLAFKEIPFWLKYERGGGSALKEAAKLLKKGIVPWEARENNKYFMAGGNGAAMRILPHVIHKQNIDLLILDVIKDCLYTHGHPRAILGASCYAYALYYLRNKKDVLEYGELIRAVIDGLKYWTTLNALPAQWLVLAEKHSGFDYLQIWFNTISNMAQKLEYIFYSLDKGLLINDDDVLKYLGCFDETSGAGDVAILSALYLASKYANNPMLGIKIAANLHNADTDTIASITGGLLGMLCGTEWIPFEWRLVQDYDCLVNITQILLADNMIETSRHISNKNKVQHNDWKDSPIGKMRILTRTVVPAGKSRSVIIDKFETTLGQTLYIKEFKDNRIIDSSQKEQENKTQTIINKKDIHHSSFLIDSNNIQELLDNPLVGRISFKKVLKIIDLLINSDLSCSEVANKLNICEEVIRLIKMQLR
ncbi:ADP-ribosylglycohydrolase [Acetivibrio thermocellus AD2]|jgi:ADP-ribosylglycohydrolase|uniref:ADP-ribosylglycohydrolase n=1 Tax=Acetivibrio thermocellus AD2 TaxID=1138384 RepID=A0AB36TID0_ACETH|nr:ADP-ribosylglycohydrolase family protein [Acetivibrio thermocellus]ADU75051.1 ADP-ribosylation/Crystallin J1 [Acetivibrio thermocellus DSM 1313]ALX09023.1 ADP-ribosylation/Crystallin J1 [Acetivibrio thermocellus AD2]ANV76772.1 ADP-ribosylation/Crystallin J1 [Acetivibrio thermocellus DSM 2360]EIC05030.1 ADP-ribosylation/Crystallin J1 [Acetivibrio thermocellus YS]PFH03296.1 ADP-ribosylglycohydrolase [Acetivibrio thermocellus AD2]